MTIQFFSSNQNNFAQISEKKLSNTQKMNKENFFYKDKKLIIRKKMFKSFKIKNVINATIKHHLPMDGIIHNVHP
jgi:hypothetical protein